MFLLIHVIVFCVLAFLGEVVSKTFLSIGGFYPALTGSKTPTSRFREKRER
ncbi:hypothetical protein [Bacillus cereus group sp. BfR-BA-01380]|uniref:hypothetical protein n=1 Tax=Bacillus cereus group sp. BfR-BA-01380 TaxID=2920324 RepID=UPI0037BEA1BE